MLIPSIDLMGGKIVQLIQGKKKALEFDDFDEWVLRFSKYPMVQLIDLDAAMGTGSNQSIVKQIAKQLPCQVGGGIRSIKAAQAVLEAGAQRVIIGSALFSDGALDRVFAGKLAHTVTAERLIFALDTIQGRVTIRGWQKMTDTSPLEMVGVLGSYCGAFLYTHVDAEGLLQGFPQEAIRPLRAATTHQLIAAGGISSRKEIDELDAIGVDAVVGMAIYKGIVSA
jgi:phosphoribosylformimino-5-aminoimidazole carboxamide ribotide isomerase